MLEKFVESKIKIERARIDKYDDITRGDIRKSHLPAPLKRYILERFEGKLSDQEFTALLAKAIKLNINYTIRPGWTLLNFLFSKYDSQQADAVKEKSGVFTFYRFYADFIVNYIDEHSLVVITKDKVARFIKEANKALHEKLVTNISGVKVKNFFIQLYRLAEKNQEDVSLTSTVPFLFIKTFLEDKEYDDILQKFDSVEDLTTETEISLKDCIKIVSDKFSPPIEKKPDGSTDIFPDDEDEQEIDGKEKDEEGDEDKEEEKVEEKDEPDSEDGGIIDVDFGGDDDIDAVYTDSGKDSDDDDMGIAINAQRVNSDDQHDAGSEFQESKLPTKVISESNLDIEKKSISRLFKHGELVSICQAVYNGDKHKMHESFRNIKEFTNWDEASDYIKDFFYDNNVDIYNKSVLLFVDVLNDYFNQLDGK